MYTVHHPYGDVNTGNAAVQEPPPPPYGMQQSAPVVPSMLQQQPADLYTTTAYSRSTPVTPTTPKPISPITVSPVYPTYDPTVMPSESAYKTPLTPQQQSYPISPQQPQPPPLPQQTSQHQQPLQPTSHLPPSPQAAAMQQPLQPTPHLHTPSQHLPPSQLLPSSSPTPPVYRLTLNIPQSDFRILVGHSAVTLKRLTQKCPGVYIVVPRAPAPPGSAVTLEGPLKACMKAKEEIEAVLMTPVSVQSQVEVKPDGSTPSSLHLPQPPSNAEVPFSDALSCSSVGSHSTLSLRTSRAPEIMPTGIADELERLSNLRTQGVLTDDEFQKVKHRLLSMFSGGGPTGSHQSDGALHKRNSQPPRGQASIQPGHRPDPDDWECDKCGNVNWAVRKECNRCKEPKPVPVDSGKGQSVRRAVVNVKVSQRSASSQVAGATNELGVVGAGRLDHTTGWMPASDSKDQWYTMDAGGTRVVSGVVLKGGGTVTAWVTMVKITTSLDFVTWKEVDSGRVFPANTDPSSAAAITFPSPVQARYVKIYPVAWHGRIIMRCGLLLCALTKGKETRGIKESTAADSSDKQSVASSSSAAKELSLSGLSDDDKALGKQAAREKLEHFYRRHNPEKLNNVPAILAFCEESGTGYATLYRRLEAKYARKGSSEKPARVRDSESNVGKVVVV
eukprot:Sspe_Gene.36536::Locus_17656_Transcript_1_1_Confidence_1.000_Length_2070::g.36536::m.36536